MSEPTFGAKWGWVLFAGVCALAVVGFFVGTTGLTPSVSVSPTPTLAHIEHEAIVQQQQNASVPVIPATRWVDIHGGNLGPNTHWKTNIGMAGNQVHNPMAQSAPQTAAEKATALAIRRQRRAYAGAPPRTPHSVTGMSVYTCQSCHVNGLSVNAGQVVAPQMPHPLYLNCLQCHETMDDQPPGGPPVGRADVSSGSTFVGAREIPQGPRYLQGAPPPQIPHSTLMRINCLSCHGPLGKQGMKTPHPWRQNCQQCHTPSAALDQRGEPNKFNAPPMIKAYIDGTSH